MTSYIVGIIDYNTGNMKSISKLFKSLGCNVFVSNKIEELKKSDLIILPGVGAFPTAMKNLIKNDLVQFLRNWSNKNKFLLGICLGMQLLCESSEENEDCKGLNIISGKILKLDDIPFNIGWRKIEFKKNHYFRGYKDDYFYFNHEYVYYGRKKNIIGTSDAPKKIVSVISINNTFGFQFHPEKSQNSGEKILKNVLQMIKK